MNVTPRCRDCGSYNLVWDWSAGDILCSECGLVHAERIVDDRPQYGETYDAYNEPNNEMYYEMAREYEGHIHKVLGDTVEVTVDKPSKASEKKTKQVAQVYEQVKQAGVSVSQLAAAVDIKESKLWRELEKQEKNEATKHPPTVNLLKNIKRLVYSCDIFPSDQHWDIIKVAMKINNAILRARDSPVHKVHFQNIKPDKLAISVIFVASHIALKKPPSNQDFCKEFKTSHTTLQKHERIILAVLDVQ